MYLKLKEKGVRLMTAAIEKKGFLKNPFRKSREKYWMVFIVSFVIMMLSFACR